VKRIVEVSLAVLSLSVVPPAFAQESQSSAASGTPAPQAAPAPKPYEEIIKLWKANLSEDFIKRQVVSGTTVYDLSADEVIRCRDAGLPESLINTMLDTKNRKPADARPAPAPVTAAPAAASAPGAPLAAEANRKWEGLARRNSGIVLKGRWDVGVLEFKEETLRWIDAKDSGKNLLIPAKQVTEQFMTCLKRAGGNECFEWGVKTKDGEYKFRDVAWQQGENSKVQELFDFMKAVYPSLVSSSVPVDSK
jgi:hypothetical protein